MDLFTKNPKRTLLSNRQTPTTARKISDVNKTPNSTITSVSARTTRTTVRQDKMKEPIPEDRDIDENVVPPKSAVTVKNEVILENVASMQTITPSDNSSLTKTGVPLKSILKHRDVTTETILQESETMPVRHASFAPDESLAMILTKQDEPGISEPKVVDEQSPKIISATKLPVGQSSKVVSASKLSTEQPLKVEPTTKLSMEQPPKAVSVTKLSIEQPSKAVAPKPTLSNLLAMHEYTPTSVLVLDNNEKLIRTINPLGYVVYIDFDDSYEIGDITTEVHTSKSEKQNSIPESVKNKSRDILLPDATGAIIEHPDKMCLMKGDKFQEYEYKDTTGLTNNNPVRIYPVIRIADIEANKNAALFATDKVNARIDNSAVVMGLEDLDHFNHRYWEIETGGTALFNTHDKMVAYIIEQVRKLKESMKKYVNMETFTDADRVEFTKIKNALAAHNTALYETIKYCELVRHDGERLAEIKNNFHTYNTELQRQFDLIKKYS